MAKLQDFNVFASREEYRPGAILMFKSLTLVSWLLVHIVNIHFAWNSPEGGWLHNSIWGQNAARPTAFSLSPTLVDIYWVVILFLQVAYMFHLWTGEHVVLAANIGPFFIAQNLLYFGFTMLWVHGHFWIAELLLIINLVNLTALYFRFPNNSPLLVHIPVISGPLAWNIVALFWCGAAMVNGQDLAARIAANVFVWTFLLVGLFFLIIFKDVSMGIELSVLMAALGVHQFYLKIVALQWIFAFTIMAILFVASLIVGLPQIFGKKVNLQKHTIEEDAERRPLLSE